jgi:hypothetical protein
MTDLRALCARMADELDHYRQLLMGDRREIHALAAEARAALAQPEPQGPTDEELLDFMPETMRADFSYAAKLSSDATGGQVKPGIFRVALNTAALEYARAVLARWGRPAIEPVPVSERLPGPEDCDGEGRCWWFSPPACGPHTIRLCWTFDSETLEGDTHWLPRWALPVPVVEGADG